MTLLTLRRKEANKMTNGEQSENLMDGWHLHLKLLLAL